MNAKKSLPVQMLVACALFAALMGVCAQIAIPMWPANICLTLFAVELSGALLRKEYALLSTVVYGLMGLFGLPVFTGFKMGPGVLFGSTGGYIIGYLFCAFLTALIIEKKGRQWYWQALGMAVGVIVCYAFGTAWFMILTHRGLVESLMLCVIPYLIGDVIKIVLAVALSRALYPQISRILKVR